MSNVRLNQNSSGATEVITQTSSPRVLRLSLRAKTTNTSIRWSEDVIDNSNMKRKSSKRCCIFHKTKKFGESDSDESDSDVETAESEPRKHNQPPNYQRFHA